jgi:peptide/nickel transport system substrate-binding protein
MRDEINMLYEVSPDAVDFVDQESSVTTHPFTRPYYYFVPFNMRHPILRRREVRQALSQAVDRQAIVRDAMRDRGEPADGPIWKYHWAYSTAQRTHQHNAEAARLRLEAAGLTGGKTAAGQMPSRFRFTCLMFGEDPRFERIALVLQKQLYDVGVDMHIEALPYLELAKRMQRGDFDALLIEITSGRSLSWVYRVWHSAHKDSVLNTGYQAADRALERVRVARTESETRAAVSEVQRVLYEDPPALFLAWPHVSRAVSSSIEVPTYDSPAKPGSDIVGRLWQFRPAAPGVARR